MYAYSSCIVMNFIRNISVYYLLAWPLTPPLRVGLPWRVLLVVAFLAFLVMSLDVFSRRVKVCFGITAIYSCFLLMLWLRYGMEQWHVFISTFIYYAFSFVFIYYLDVGFDKFKNVFFAIIASLSVWNITTILALIDDPTICRRLGNSSDDLSKVNLSMAQLLMAGGFATVYSCALLIPRMLDLLKRGSRGNLNTLAFREKIVVATFLITALIVVLFASYSIAIVILFIGVLLWLFRERLSLAWLVGLTFLLGICFLSMKGIIYESLLYFAGDNLFYVNKIEALFNPTSSRLEADSRFFVWGVSLHSFLENPVFGAGESGGHSGILDLLGLYGGFLGLGMMWLFFLPFFMLWKTAKLAGVNGILIAAWVPFAVLLFMNQLPFAYGTVIFALTPYIITQYYFPLRGGAAPCQSSHNTREILPGIHRLK